MNIVPIQGNSLVKLTKQSSLARQTRTNRVIKFAKGAGRDGEKVSDVGCELIIILPHGVILSQLPTVSSSPTTAASASYYKIRESPYHVLLLAKERSAETNNG